MPKPKHKMVLFHKPTQTYAARNCGKFTNPERYSYTRRNIKPIEEFLTDNLQDCRIFNNKSSAANTFIYQENKDDFEILPVKLTLI